MTQHQADLIRDTRLLEYLGDALGVGEIGGQGLFTEDRFAGIGGRLHQTQVFGRPCADVHRIAGCQHLIDR